MNLIEFFGLNIKPRLTAGKRMWKPEPTGRLFDNIYALRDKDVDLFLIKDCEGGYIAIDSGYKNSANVRAGRKQFGFASEKVHTELLTHLDIDHAGGMDANSACVFPNARLYIGAQEEKYLTGCFFRKKILFHNCRLPVSLRAYQTLENGEVVEPGGQRIEAVFTPGHTLGHTAYLLNGKYLFSGDCIIANQEGGYSFFDFWNADSELNRKTLRILHALCEERGVEKVVTSHSGVVDTEAAFRHIDTSPQWRARGFVFDKTAEDDPYSHL